MNTLFRILTLCMCDGDPLERGLHRALLALRQHVPACRASLTALTHGDRRLTRVVAEADLEEGRRADLMLAMPSEAVEWASDIETDDVVVVDNPAAHPLFRDITRELMVGASGSLMLAPLGIGRRAVGGLTLFSEVRGCFTPEHAELLKSVNEPFAIALEQWSQRESLLRLQQQLLEDRRALEHELWTSAERPIVGEHFGLKRVMAQLRRVATSPAPVLLFGETGVGKDVLANALHRGSRRATGPFVKMNCGAISESLIDSELFGHEAGAFTGARARHRGRFERAQGGTLFLDEIGELPAAAQMRLLRVLQHGEIERVGGVETLHVDVRIVAATHRDLAGMVAEGKFREDLWFRLNVFPITVPPLRERLEDIPALVHHILHLKAQSLRRGTVPELAPGTLEALRAYHWPGNVRELENVLERALIVHEGGLLHIELKARPTSGPPAVAAEGSEGAVLTLDEVTAEYIRKTLERTNGRIHGPNGAASLLGVRATTLRHRMDKLGVPYRRRDRDGA